MHKEEKHKVIVERKDEMSTTACHTALWCFIDESEIRWVVCPRTNQPQCATNSRSSAAILRCTMCKDVLRDDESLERE